MQCRNHFREKKNSPKTSTAFLKTHCRYTSLPLDDSLATEWMCEQSCGWSERGDGALQQTATKNTEPNKKQTPNPHSSCPPSSLLLYFLLHLSPSIRRRERERCFFTLPRMISHLCTLQHLILFCSVQLGHRGKKQIISDHICKHCSNKAISTARTMLLSGHLDPM